MASVSKALTFKSLNLLAPDSQQELQENDLIAGSPYAKLHKAWERGFILITSISTICHDVETMLA